MPTLEAGTLSESEEQRQQVLASGVMQRWPFPPIVPQQPQWLYPPPVYTHGYQPVGRPFYLPFHNVWNTQVSRSFVTTWPTKNGQRIVKRQHLNHNGKHNAENAMAFLSAKLGMREANQSTDEMKEFAKNEMNREKKHITAWATEQVSKMIIEAAQKYNWTFNQRPVNHIRDIGKALRQADSKENFDKAYHCLFGIFEKKRNWASLLEAEYMANCHLVYSEECDETKKGYVEKIISQAKVDKVKIINKSTAGLHNKRVGISRPTSTITAKMKFRKKPAGEYYLTIPNDSWYEVHSTADEGKHDDQKLKYEDNKSLSSGEITVRLEDIETSNQVPVVLEQRNESETLPLLQFGVLEARMKSLERSSVKEHNFQERKRKEVSLQNEAMKEKENGEILNVGNKKRDKKQKDQKKRKVPQRSMNSDTETEDDEEELEATTKWIIEGHSSDYEAQNGGGPWFMLNTGGEPAYWALCTNVCQDIPQKVREYIELKWDRAEYDMLLQEAAVENKKKTKKKKQKQVVTMPVPVPAEDTNSENSTDEEADGCTHTQYTLGTSYNTEVSAGQCGGKYYLAGLGCANCSRRFKSEKTVDQEKEFRPTMTLPVYTCCNNNNSLGCRHAICGHCWLVAMKRFIPTIATQGRAKRRRDRRNNLVAV